MNDLIFACPRCREFIDAGYRWAYWGLEVPGVVRQGEMVSIDRVMSATVYWDIDDSAASTWLRDKVLPKVRTFLTDHQDHGVVYAEDEWVWLREEIGEVWNEIETWKKRP